MNTSSPNPFLVEEHRTSMRSAHEVSDHLVEWAPVPPQAVTIQTDALAGWPGYGVNMYFRHASDVAAFADRVGALMVETTEELGGEWSRKSEARSELAGVPFRAWTRTAVVAATVHHLSVLDVTQAEQVLRDAILRDPEQQVAYSESIVLVTHPEIAVSTDSDYGWWKPSMGCVPTPTRNSVQAVA